jgi:anti-anti-sigma regulatory factor
MNFEHAISIDGSVLQCMLALRQMIRKREARLVLAGLGREVYRLFDLAKVASLFDICPTLSAAIDSVHGHERRLGRLTLVARPSFTAATDPVTDE